MRTKAQRPCSIFVPFFLAGGALLGCAGGDGSTDSENTGTEDGVTSGSGGWGFVEMASGGYPTVVGATGGADGIVPGAGGAIGVGGSVLPATGGTDAVGGSPGTGGEQTTGGAAGTGGVEASGGSTSCNSPAPPADMVQTLDLTWKEMAGGFEGETGARPVSASIATFRNTILDQIMEGDGTLNYCVRNESSQPISSALRVKIESALSRAMNKWIAKLDGHDCFPYDSVDVKVSGWATQTRNLLQWADDAIPIYVGQNDGDGAPKCPDTCSRFEHREEGYTYPSCPGGFDNHFDLSLWLTDDFGYVGGDWGQRLDRDYVVNNIDQDNQHILIHEMGHGFGFPDYYNWSVWAPGVAAPACVMNAGAANQVTEWDGWMIRRTWSEIKDRWQ